MDMAGKYSATVDPANAILELKMRGFWSEEEAQAMSVLFRRQVDTLSGNGQKRFKVLIDATDFPAQSEKVRALILQNMSYSVEKGLEKSARIVGKATTQLQFKNLAKEALTDKDPNAAQFGEFYTRAEALQWLGLEGRRP